MALIWRARPARVEELLVAGREARPPDRGGRDRHARNRDGNQASRHGETPSEAAERILRDEE
jgi:hypothetical protein